MVASIANDEHVQDDGRSQGRVVIFAPSPLLTITVEESASGGDVHLHAGGQGIWQARMLVSMGVHATLCASFGGESGRVLRHLIEQNEDVELRGVDRDGDSAVYIHDRRGGERVPVIETHGTPLSRHALDELYGVMLGEAMTSDVALLSGPSSEDALPHDVYRRLAADLRACRCRVIVDLAGARLDAAVSGGVDIVKVSHEELLVDGRITDDDEGQIVTVMRALHRAGADVVVVTRSHRGMLVLDDDCVRRVTAPTMEVVDARGAGDSFTAALAATLARGGDLDEALILGAAAGALNVTRHGLGTGDSAAIRRLSELVRITPIEASAPTQLSVTTDQLTSLVIEE